MYDHKFDEVPIPVWHFQNLDVLNLVNCDLSILSENLGNLVTLRELYIGGNQLKKIFSNIGYLHNLEVLYLLEDQLEELPISISNLNNLQELSISSKNSIKIHDDILKLKETGCRIFLNQEQI